MTLECSMVIDTRVGTVSVMPTHHRCSHIWTGFSTMWYIVVFYSSICDTHPWRCQIEGLGWEEDVTRMDRGEGEGAWGTTVHRNLISGQRFVYFTVLGRPPDPGRESTFESTFQIFH